MLSPKAMDGEFLTSAVRRVLDGAATDVFCEWFVTALHARAKAAPPLAADSRRFLLHLARQFWGHVPRPTANWRVQAAAKIERNDTCYCGSGKKYKQCCAEYATMPFPIPANAMFALALDTVKPRGEDWLTGGWPCYGIYRTLDERFMAIGALEEKFWHGLCGALAKPHLKALGCSEGVVSLRVRKELADCFGAQPMTHWIEIFDALDCCVTPVLTLAEAKQHPLFKEHS